MKLKLLIGLSVFLLMSACASKDPKKIALKPADLVEFDASAKFKKRWTLSAGEGQDKRYTRFVPALSDTLIVVADVEGNVFAYDKVSRKRVWKNKTSKPISAAIALDDGKAVFGTYKGRVVALSLDDGQQLWEAKTSSEILAVPAIAYGVVVAQTLDGRLYGFSAETGEKLWQYDHTVPALTLRGTANPVITRNQVLAAFGNGQLVSLGLKDGALQWTGRVGQSKGSTELDRIVDIDASPLVDGALVYSATFNGAIASFSKAKGQVMWKQDVSTYQDLASAGGRLFAVNDDSHVIAFNAGSGAIEWTNKQLHRRNLGAPLAYKGYLITIDDDGYMHVLSQVDGSFVARNKVAGEGFTSPLVILDDLILVLSKDGKLSSYSLVE